VRESGAKRSGSAADLNLRRFEADLAKHLSTVLLPLMVMLGSVVTVSAAGAPKSSSRSQVIPQAAAAQLPLDALATKLNSVVSTEKSSGFSGVAYEGSTFVLYWRGVVPPPIQQIINQGRQSLRIQLRATRFSLEELDRAERQIMSRFSGSVLAVAPRLDYSGLHVTVDQSSQTSLAKPTSALADLATTLSAAVSPIGVDVILEQKPAMLSCPPTSCPPRWNDSKPFYGGDAIKATNGTYCSTSFEVGNYSSDQSGILTANHCGENLKWYSPATNGNYQGISALCCASQDVMPVTLYHLLPNGDYDPDLWIGPWTGTQHAHTTGQWSGAAVGQLTYLGGGFTGETATYVTAINVYANISGYEVGPGDYTHKPGNAAGDGDSGGGQYTYNAGGTLSAMGTISLGIGGTVTCTGNTNLSRKCYSTIFCPYIGPELASINSYLVH
jgi:streptogrisin D